VISLLSNIFLCLCLYYLLTITPHPGSVEAKQLSTVVSSLWKKVGLLEAKMQTNEQRVDELQKKAEESRRELEMETLKKTEEAHNKLEERLRKRNQKKKKKKIAVAKQNQISPATVDAGSAADSRRLFN